MGAMHLDLDPVLPTTLAARAALDVLHRLRGAGFEAYLAGGCVRDLVMGMAPKDYDVATDARPDEVCALFPRTVSVGEAFGVVRARVALEGHVRLHEIEVATFREDLGYSDGRRPDGVRFTSARTDVARRDFTINGLLMDPDRPSGRVIDWVGGVEDLRARLVRAIGEPDARFDEDALRLLRAVRFGARLEFAIEPRTLASIRDRAPSLARVSPERLRDELVKMLVHPTAALALGLLVDTALLPSALPLLATVPQGAITALRRIAALHDRSGHAPVDGPLALAAVHLDVPMTTDALAARLGTDLRLSKAETRRLTGLLHVAREAAEVARARSFAPKARLLRRPEAASGLLLALSEHAWRGEPMDDVGALHGLLEATPHDVFAPPRLVTGDLLKARGHRTGPAFRAALEAAETAQLEGGGAEAAIEAAERALRAS